MEPWLDVEVWERVARKIAHHRASGFAAILTEDVLRFASAKELATAGVTASELGVERAHPQIKGSRVDLVVGRPIVAALEFKYPREPIEKNAAWTMALGEVIKDFYRLAAYPDSADRVFVLAQSSRLRTYFAPHGARGVDIDVDEVRLRAASVMRLPKTARDSIGGVLERYDVDARRIASVPVDADLRLQVYRVTSTLDLDEEPTVSLAPAEELLVADDGVAHSGGGARVTIWDQLAECVAQLHEPFTRAEIVSWFRRHHPETLESSLGMHIQSTASNAGHATGQFANRRPLLTRVDYGTYRRFVGSPRPVEPPVV